MADDTPESHLTALGETFLKALALRADGRSDDALELFAEILRKEPRLAEPRIERARVWLERERLEDAEVDVREALRILENGGQWTEDVPENVVLSIAWALLGEILKQQASSDEVVFGDPARFAELLELSRAAFARAAELDPEDEVSAINAAELGDVGGGDEELEN